MKEYEKVGGQPPFLVRLWKKYMTRELVTYGIAGVLTTLVNLALFHVLCNVLHMDEMVDNVIAWVGAVLFAYFVNDIWVFRSKRAGIKEELSKFLKFVGARVASLGVEEVGIFVFVIQMHWNNMLVKAGLAVVVILMNYVFSKLFIFTKKKQELEDVADGVLPKQK